MTEARTRTISSLPSPPAVKLSGTPNRASTSQSGSPWRTGQHRIKGNRPLGALERLRSHPRLAFREHLSHLRTSSLLGRLTESEGDRKRVVEGKNVSVGVGLGGDPR